MPEIIRGEDGIERIRIDGEIYPIANLSDPNVEAEYRAKFEKHVPPDKMIDIKIDRSTVRCNDSKSDNKFFLTGVSLETTNDPYTDRVKKLQTVIKSDGCDSQTTSELSVTYSGEYSNKILNQVPDDMDLKDRIIGHLSRLRINGEHRQRILDRTGISSNLITRRMLEAFDDFLVHIGVPTYVDENETWAKIDVWIETTFPEEVQSSTPANPDPIPALVSKLESTCDQKPVENDIFVQISKSNDKILEQVIPTFIKVIDKQMQNIDITIHKDMCSNIVNKYGNTAHVPDIEVDNEGNLIAAIVEVRLVDVYDALPYELTETYNEHGGDLPTYDSFLYFVATLHIVITTAISDHYPTMDMKFAFEANDGTAINVMNEVVCENLGNRDLQAMAVLSIKISKPTQNSENDKQLFLRVLKDRVMYYVNNRNYTRLTPDLKNICYEIPLIVLTNNELAALQKDDVCKLLNPIYSTLLDSTNYYNGYLYKFLKKNYREIFEIFMEYDKYAYVYTADSYTGYLSLEPKPRWYSYITQPALRKKRKKHN